MVAGIVLAAGESSRMGFPKPLLPYRATTFLGHLLEVLHGQVEPLLVVLGHEAERIRKAVPPDITIVINPNYHLGQLSSLQSAIRNLQSATATLVALVDHPCISRELVALLVRTFDQERPPVLIPIYRGRRGHPMIFAGELFPELLQAPLDQGARWVVRRHQVRELPVEEEGILVDVDDPEAYYRLTGSSVPESA